ncbi:MAG: hypothetical protein GEU92_15010 [Alphaproteobacteria bacterium]|nr:hypothetical protein [Alphaproteobacteria bacterium]
MKIARRSRLNRLAAVFGALAILANVLAPAALAGAGARAKAAMFAGPFDAPICQGGSVADTPVPPGGDAGPGLHCPLCPGPAATALASAAGTAPAVAVGWLAVAVPVQAARVASFETPSRHRPRAPPCPS